MIEESKEQGLLEPPLSSSKIYNFPRLFARARWLLASSLVISGGINYFSQQQEVRGAPLQANDLSWTIDPNQLDCPMANSAHARLSNNRIVAIAGSNLEGVNCSESPLYSKKAVYRDPTNGDWLSLPDMPMASTNGAASEIKTGALAGSVLYGGGEGIENSVVTALNKVWALKPDNTWVALPDMPTRRQGHKVETMGKFVVFAGGFDQNGATLQSVDALNTDTMAYINIPDMSVPRADFGSTIGLDGRMIASAGSPGSGGSKSVEMLKADLSGWELKPELELLTARWGHEIVYDPSTGKLMTIGGKDGLTGETLSSVEQHHVVTGTREFNNSILIPRVAFMAQRIGSGEYIIVGGETSTIPSKLKTGEKGTLSNNITSTPTITTATPTATRTPVPIINTPTSSPTNPTQPGPTSTPDTSTPDRPKQVVYGLGVPVVAVDVPKITQ